MTTSDAAQEKTHKPHVIHLSIDGDPYETAEKALSARQILGLAGLDVAKYYLVEIRGNEQISFQDRPDEPIHLHERMKFVSVSMGPTNVS